jgi:hypothetical protein
VKLLQGSIANYWPGVGGAPGEEGVAYLASGCRGDVKSGTFESLVDLSRFSGQRLKITIDGAQNLVHGEDPGANVYLSATCDAPGLLEYGGSYATPHKSVGFTFSNSFAFARLTILNNSDQGVTYTLWRMS